MTPEELRENEALVADFVKPGGQGEALRQSLIQYAATQHNWLEQWWDDSYLDIRTRTHRVCAWMGRRRAGAFVPLQHSRSFEARDRVLSPRPRCSRVRITITPYVYCILRRRGPLPARAAGNVGMNPNCV